MIVAAATRLEAGAARRALRGRGVDVVRLGVGGALVWVAEGAGPVVVVGLCGALASLEPGTVVVPGQVGEAEGPLIPCHPALTTRLREAARARGWRVATGAQLTVPAIVRGAERRRWAAAGFETVDMEAALALRRVPGAVVRVVLDAPGHELPTPAQLLDPGRWPAAARLAWHAPAYARRAAELAASLVGVV